VPAAVAVKTAVVNSHRGRDTRSLRHRS